MVLLLILQTLSVQLPNCYCTTNRLNPPLFLSIQRFQIQIYNVLYMIDLSDTLKTLKDISVTLVLSPKHLHSEYKI